MPLLEGGQQAPCVALRLLAGDQAEALEQAEDPRSGALVLGPHREHHGYLEPAAGLTERTRRIRLLRLALYTFATQKNRTFSAIFAPETDIFPHCRMRHASTAKKPDIFGHLAVSEMHMS
jgi:hypothetical protein